MMAPQEKHETPCLPERYANLVLVGAGGSGRVFKAHDRARNLDLALKVVGFAESSWLRREFGTLRQIRHENLIRVFDWGTLPAGDAYYTMELVEGGDWGAKFGRPQSAEDVTHILAGIGRALAHLHSHGEIHGDLKPGNVLLGVDDNVKLSDVGMGGSEGVDHGSSGTPGYAAPEVWEGAPRDIRSDIYSVGVMAYEAVAGRHPFVGKTIKDVVTGQLEGWVPSVRAHGVTVPPSFETAVMRALERNPALRHGSVDEFLEELGVEDRVGEILGGKIVCREEEISELDRALSSEKPEAAILIHISGPPGMGKSSLVEEFSQRLIAQGGRVLRPSTSSARGLADALSHADDAAPPARNPSLSDTASQLAMASSEMSIVVHFTTPQGEDKSALDFVRSLGRYLWAHFVELGSRNPILLCFEHETPPAELDEFEGHIPLKSLELAGTEALIAGTLGGASLEPEVISKIHSVAGGSPGGIRALILELAGSGQLQRVAGTWRFSKAGRLADLSLSGATSRWAFAWGRLSAEHRSVLSLLSRLSRGLAIASLERALPEHSRLLPDLASRGWVRATSRGWVLAAEEIRAAVEHLADGSESRSAEERLLADQGSGLSREERAALLVRVGSPKEALEEALWAAEQAASRGEFSLARDRAAECLKIAMAEGDARAAQRAALNLGEALHQLGRDDEADEALQREDVWGMKETAPTASGRRLYVRGTIAGARGRMPEARKFLTSAIEVAEIGGDLSVFLRAHADLAEMDWRSGDEATRAASMQRVRSVLGRHFADGKFNDEQAALSYQYGSALILAGERDEARQLLMQALELKPGDFWRMRISNALAAACFQLGDFDKSLEWLVEAWRCAERGGIDAFKARILSNRAGLFYGVGRFREAVEGHSSSAQWARRTGNAYEFQFSRVGGSINLTLLGRYEEAIGLAREALHASERIGAANDCAKALEIEALAHYYIGDFDESRRLVLEALGRMKDHGFDDVVPRLRWLLARIDIENGNFESADASLAIAEKELQRTKDWEDLPGVQIELQLLRFRKQDSRFRLDEIKRLAWDAESHRARIVYLYGSLAVAEVVLAGGTNDGKDREFLLDALARAEESGAAEFSWRLSQVLGEVACRDGDMRGASARYAHSLRRFREIADHLAPSYRRFYLSTAHATRFLKRAAELNS